MSKLHEAITVLKKPSANQTTRCAGSIDHKTLLKAVALVTLDFGLQPYYMAFMPEYLYGMTQVDEW